MRALRAYHWDPRRPKENLSRVKAALTIKANTPGIKPKAKDEALRCIEIIDIFERSENALGMRPMALSEPPNFEMIEIAGVMVSIRPDMIVSGGDRRVGAGIIRVAKAPDPEACKTEVAKARRGDHRREMARYLIALLQMLLDRQNGALGIPARELCFVADVRLGERIGPAADHTRRMRAIEGACEQITKLWPTVEPKPRLFKKD